MIRKSLLTVIVAMLCIVLAAPAMAQENPYRNAGKVTAADVPVPIGSDSVALSDTSSVTFAGAGYTHRIGRVSIIMTPQIAGLDGKSETKGNMRLVGGDTSLRYEVHRDLIKEYVTLKDPGTVRFSYELGLSDWVTNEPDESRPEIIRDANNTEIVTYPYSRQVTSYAKDSTIDINKDPWGNLVVLVNSEDVVVMPRPHAVDAAGKRFDLDFELDKEKKTVTITGDLTGARYPIAIDPTERVTNGGFETGSLNGWTRSGSPESYSVASGVAYNGTYYLDVIGGSWAYSGISQTISYTGAISVSNAAEIPVRNRYNIPMSDLVFDWNNWLLDTPGQNPHGWQAKSTAPGMTGSGTIALWTYDTTHGHIDSIRVDPSIPDPAPVADFTGSPTSGYAPLAVQFTDQSTGSPTSWSWGFGDSGTSTLQNPSHEYTSAGTYTVSLTATNEGGSDTETKEGYITVTSPTVNYYVFSDGIRYYHDYGGNEDLPGADTTAQYFYGHLTDGSRCHEYDGTNYCWNERSNPVNDNTGSLYWSKTESADTIGANSAEFAFHAGHGWEDGILFGTANSYHHAFRTNMSFSRAKWVAFDSCLMLNATYQTNWESVFDGLHILMGFDTVGQIDEDIGPQFVERMRGGIYEGEVYQRTPIRDAWESTLRHTVQDSSLKGAYMWVYPSGDDYLPGYGDFREPVMSNGEYAYNWSSFFCTP